MLTAWQSASFLFFLSQMVATKVGSLSKTFLGPVLKNLASNEFISEN